jgi:tetratricopeptide (TPR) repeat protein/predicted Zn-dependent protease
VEDPAKEPRSVNSSSDPAWLAQIESALEQLRREADPAPILDALESRARATGQAMALGAALATLATSEQLASVPERARLAIWLRAARWPGLDAAGRTSLAERYAAAARSGSTERERRLLEPALASFESVEPAGAAARLLRERLSQLPRAEQSEQALLLAAKVGSKDAEAALLTLLERWLNSGRAVEGVAKLPRSAAGLQSEAGLDLLERLFTEAGASDAYLELLEHRVTLETSSLGTARALEKLGSSWLERDQARAAESFLRAAVSYEAASELEEAERLLERVLAIAPEHVPATSKLVALRAQTGNFAGAAQAFAALLRLEADSRQAGELLLSLAAAAEQAGVADEFAELADDVCWRLGSDERELTQRLLRASARLLSLQTRYDEAAEHYRRLIADQATSEDLDAYQALIDSNPASSWRSNQQRWLFEWQEHHSADRPTVLLSWARFEEQELGDPALAQAVLERAAQTFPDRPEIWDNLTRLRLAAGDGAGGVAASHELRRLGREPDASLLELLLEHEPGARWAIDRVKLKLSSEARWPELFELYERAIEAAGNESERASWLNEAAIAARDVAQDPERAVQYWEQYLALVPDDLRADMALGRLYEQAGDQPSLLLHLQRRARRSEPAEQAELYPRIIALALEVGALDDALAAIDQLPSATPETSVRWLEQLLARSQELGGSEDTRAASETAARRLRGIYLERGETDAALRLLRAELELGPEPATRHALLAELSHLSEAEGDRSGAFDAERELFLATRDDAHREHLEVLARALGSWVELCETLALAAETEPEVEGKRRLLAHAARLASREAHDPLLATRFYGQMFQLDPERAPAEYERLEAAAEGQPEAFEALCRLLEAAGHFEALAEVLERGASRDPKLFSRLGRLQAEQLDDTAAAIRSHLLACDARSAGQVFLREPSVFAEDGAPAIELATRLNAAGLTEGSLLVLRHQLAFYAERTPPERKPVVLALVALLEESGEVDAARDELREAAKHFPTDAEVQRACAENAASAEDWDTAEQYYRTLLLLLHGSNVASLSRAAVYVELAQIKRARDDEPAAAGLIDSGFEAALGSAPDLTALAEALLKHGMHAEAERAIGDLLKLARELPAAARALACLAELGRSQRAPTELKARAAELAERVASRYRELADARERESLLTACVGLLPLEKAEQLLLEAKDELTAEQATGARLELSRRLLESGEPERRTRALRELQGLLGHSEAEAEAWPLLVQGLESEGRSDELERLLTARLEREPTDALALCAAFRLALSQSNLARALELYERLTRDGAWRDAELSARLRRLCLERGDTQAAVTLLCGEAQREPDAESKAKLLLETAELWFAQGNVTEARKAGSDARLADPGSAEAVLLSAKLALAEGRRGDALGWLSDYAESKLRRRGPALARVLRLAAELRLQNDELSEALPLLLEAHQLDKTDLETALLLGLLAIDLDRLDTASSALRAVIAEREGGSRDSPPSPSIAQGYLQLARIEQHHGKKINAKRLALRALEENPNLAPAQRLLSQLGPH